MAAKCRKIRPCHVRRNVSSQEGIPTRTDRPLFTRHRRQQSCRAFCEVFGCCVRWATSFPARVPGGSNPAPEVWISRSQECRVQLQRRPSDLSGASCSFWSCRANPHVSAAAYQMTRHRYANLNAPAVNQRSAVCRRHTNSIIQSKGRGSGSFFFRKTHQPFLSPFRRSPFFDKFPSVGPPRQPVLPVGLRRELRADGAEGSGSRGR